MDRGFILDATYRIERGRPVIHLFGVGEQEESFVVRDTRTRPSFFVESRQLEAVESLLAPHRADTGWPRILERPWRTLAGEPASEIEVAIPADVPAWRARFAQAGIVCHEADLPFATRFLIDHGIRGALAIDGRACPGRLVHRVYQDPEIHADTWVPALRVISLDIETDWQAREVRSFALYGRVARGARAAEVHAVALPGHHERPAVVEEGAAPAPCYYHRDEAHLLQALARRMRELDPDVLTGWNLIGFDLTVLERAFRRADLPFHLGRADLPTRIRPPDENWMTGRASIPGRAVLDGMNLLRGAFVRLDDFSLDTAARAILGEGKLLAAGERRTEIERLYHQDLPRLLLYNLTDARLVVEILERLKLVPLAAQRSLLTGLPIERAGASIAAFDFLYIAELHRRGIAAPSVERPAGAPASGRARRGAPGGIPGDGALQGFEELEEARPEAGLPEEISRPVPIGGHVLEPVPGIHRNVWLFDYRSLYPSVILTFNIDPLGYLEANKLLEGGGSTAFSEGFDPSATIAGASIRAPNGALFHRQAAILPEILGRLMPAREAARRAGDAVGSTAIKILMNSFYGVLATPRCRFHDTRVANAITTFGRAILLWTREHLEQLGHPVIYGDTDSVFVLSGVSDPGEAEARGRSVVAGLNDALAAWVAREYGVASHLKLLFERCYGKFFIPSHRGAAEGSKKRYAGLVETAAGRELVITGFESVRRDWTPLAKDFQRRLLRLVLEEEPVEDFVAGFVRDLREGRRDEDLVYRKTLRKPLEAYGKTGPPHVRAARLMEGAHQRVVSYVMTRAGPQPLGFVTAPLDREHYLEKQLRPIADALLVHIGTSLERILGRGDQLGLL